MADPHDEGDADEAETSKRMGIPGCMTFIVAMILLLVAATVICIAYPPKP